MVYNTEISPLTVLEVRRLEVRSPKSIYSRTVLPLKSLGENPPLPLLALAVPGVPWLVAAQLQSLPLSSHVHLACVSLCVLASS